MLKPLRLPGKRNRQPEEILIFYVVATFAAGRKAIRQQQITFGKDFSGRFNALLLKFSSISGLLAVNTR